MATKAAWALASLLGKCEIAETEGVNEYPNQRTSSLGGNIELSRWTGERETRPLSLIVLQWMSSVFGIEKLTSSRAPLAFSTG